MAIKSYDVRYLDNVAINIGTMFEYAVAVYACLFDHVKGLRYGVAYMIWHVCIASRGDELATHICIHLHYLALGHKVHQRCGEA